MSVESAALEELIKQRKDKLKWLEAQGMSAYPARFKVEEKISEIINDSERFLSEEAEKNHVVAGRLMSMRLMGKAAFSHVKDASGKIQIYVKQDVIGEKPYQVFKKGVDIGDWIGVEGNLFKTRTGELTLNVKKLTVLSKTLRPLPEKWHGLKDVEVRYRQRYVDLIVNDGVKEIFIKRSKIINSVRKTLEGKNFLEVETPQMQMIPGGALAKPFKTFHNALDTSLYMRIAPELYLKRLIVGGFDRIFEIGRCFRNEGIDTRHNPEFTMVEAYCAYADYEGMMRLTEDIFSDVQKSLGLPDELSYRGVKFSIKTPFKRLSIPDLFEQYAGQRLNIPLERGQLEETAKKHKIEFGKNDPVIKIFDHIFDNLVVPKITDPVFVTDFPKEFSPLAKSSPDNKDIAERFELFIAGEEIANAYSELNDPIEQSGIFRSQAEIKLEDQKENAYDSDYIRALEYGMPPTGGLGIGIDRLVMVLTGTESIREVILFPLLRQEK